MKSMSNNGSIYYSSDVSSVKSCLQPFWKHIYIFICQVKAIMQTFLFQPERLFQCYFLYMLSTCIAWHYKKWKQKGRGKHSSIDWETVPSIFNHGKQIMPGQMNTPYKYDTLHYIQCQQCEYFGQVNLFATYLGNRRYLAKKCANNRSDAYFHTFHTKHLGFAG